MDISAIVSAIADQVTIARAGVETGCWAQSTGCGTDAVGAISGAVALALGLTAYILSVFTGNDSWVDRSWSIVPVAFAWLYVWLRNDTVVIAVGDSWRVTNLGAVALGITVWGIRLTYNFYRRGGYEKGGEDYRWEHVRSWSCWRHRWLWHLFSFGFISVFQELLLWGLSVPMLALPPRQAASPMTLTCTLTLLALIAFEATADQQQWNFQNEKRNLASQRAALAGDYDAGFLTHGLFAFSRHPNVWAEQQIWVVVYAASVPVWGLCNASVIGALTLILLTLRSCALTEELSSAKYPLYTAYQKAVPMLIPAPWSMRAGVDRHRVKAQ